MITFDLLEQEGCKNFRIVKRLSIIDSLFYGLPLSDARIHY
jgi:hypothetical protein